MRYATPISTRGYRALLGAVVMAVVGSTAACSDEATAPTPVAAAELRGPQASINRFPPVGATVTVRIADILGQTINEANLQLGTQQIVDLNWTSDSRLLMFFDASGPIYLWGIGA